VTRKEISSAADYRGKQTAFEGQMPDINPGTVVAVAAGPRHRFSKTVQDQILLAQDHGVEGDAHAGAFISHRYLARWRRRLPNTRQVHLIPSELFERLRETGYEIGPGDLGENVTTAGLALERLPLGTRIHLGTEAVVELTGLRTPCTLIDKFRSGLRGHVLSSAETGPSFRCGVLGVVRAGGPVCAGDRARVLLPDGPPRMLPSL
jgi:hypothetical protein